MNILIVEDTLDQRLILSKFLKNKNYCVYEAADGVEAIELLKAHENIQIVISDWMMPNMDGLELIESIRNSTFKHYIYCILLTGKNQPDSLVQGMNKGADDFINKPIDFDELEARLNAGIRIVKLESVLARRNQQLSKALSVIDKDLKSAAEMQNALLCSPMDIQGVRFDWFFKPSNILGGDMFGYFALDDHHVGFYQLDVMGHGIPAALFSFSLNRIFSETSIQDSVTKESTTDSPYYKIRTPSEVLKVLNRRFQSTAETMHYFTIIYGMINTNTGQLILSRAGHPPGFWLRVKDKKIDKFKLEGLPIGFSPDASYDNLYIDLESNDRLFFYSDGVTDCYNSNEEPFDEIRLKACLSKSFNKSTNEAVQYVKENIQNWNGKSSFEDDVSFLILEWNP